MEDYRPPDRFRSGGSDDERRRYRRDPQDESGPVIEMEKVGAEETLERIRRDRDKAASRRIWGRVLVVLGAITVLDSCSVFPIPLIGPPALFIGCALMLIGAGFLARVPRMRETNEALMIALRHDNRLTVPLLALEMDITLERAEKIIGKLVKSGVAEIDLDDSNDDGGITYRIKGI